MSEYAVNLGLVKKMDIGQTSAFLSVNVAILVGVLVFSSVLELVSSQDKDRFSLDDVELRKHIDRVFSLVQGVVLSSGGGVISSVAAIFFSAKWLSDASGILAVLAAILFMTLSTITIQKLWRR